MYLIQPHTTTCSIKCYKNRNHLTSLHCKRNSRKLSSYFSHSYVRNFISMPYLITPDQHGLLCNRPCVVVQLLSVLHSIGQKLDKNEQTDIVNLNFAKAFDSINGSVLLQKLKCNDRQAVKLVN